MDVPVLPWAVKFRRSHRAKRLRINLGHGKPVEVVYPFSATKRDAIHFLTKSIAWIDKQPCRILKRDQPRVELPERIVLQSIDELWHVNYAYDGTTEGLYHDDQNKILTVFQRSKSSEYQHEYDQLKCWLKSKATKHLSPELGRLSQLHGLSYQSLSWRFQKGRWGSCSSSNQINLNAKLLFLPKSLVQYVMLHELCHTLVKNHSAEFWKLMRMHLIDAKVRDKELKYIQPQLQQWISYL